jgi:AraC-like DNA-binding protein
MLTTATPLLRPESDHVSGHVLHSGSGEGPAFSVRRTRVARRNPDVALTWGGAEGCVARLNLLSLPANQIAQGKNVITLPPRAALETSFRNIREPCAWPMAHPVDQISFEFPEAAVARWAEDQIIGKGLLLEIMSGASVADPVLVAFGMALLPILEGSVPPAPFFVDHLLDGVCAYILQTFGTPRSMSRGGLAPWQERRAKEMMDAVGAELSLADLAAACGVSVAHFSRAFKVTCGMTPHRWRMSRRIEKAQDLLRQTDLPLTLIAIECGFADQAHLTNVFSKHFGLPPGALRRYWNSQPSPASKAPAGYVRRTTRS